MRLYAGINLHSSNNYPAVNDGQDLPIKKKPISGNAVMEKSSHGSHFSA